MHTRNLTLTTLLGLSLAVATYPAATAAQLQDTGSADTSVSDAMEKTGKEAKETTQKAIEAVKSASKDAKDKAVEAGEVAYEKLQDLYVQAQEKSENSSGKAAKNWAETKRQIGEMMEDAKTTLGEWKSAADDKWDDVKIKLANQFEKIADAIEASGS